jgi:hypothetical protein
MKLSTFLFKTRIKINIDLVRFSKIMPVLTINKCLVFVILIFLKFLTENVRDEYAKA